MKNIRALHRVSKKTDTVVSMDCADLSINNCVASLQLIPYMKELVTFIITIIIN